VRRFGYKCLGGSVSIPPGRFICLAGKRQPIFFRWRPTLPDPADDMVLELAVAANCDAIVTHNRRHFRGVGRFGIRVLSPAKFLVELGDRNE
jgi:PIN domain